MNRKERRNLQRQGVQVPKDPTLNIKLSALGKSIMTPEMQMSNNGKRRCWPMSPKPWENAEGYADPTAYNAIKKVSAEGHEALDAKVNTLIKVLKFIIAESGFELAARIELRDRKTGRFFR